jgi:hypothetical protein
MTVYVLTEPELDRLGEMNGIAAAFSSLATFFAALWLDLYKDEALAQNVPEATQIALNFVQPLIAVLAIAFGVTAAVFWYRRGRYQARIKRDSKSKSRVRGEVRQPLEGDDAG